MNSLPTKSFNDDEYFYRGVVEACWNFDENRPSSSAFKDSLGVSVDRSAGRSEDTCVRFLESKKKFQGIVKVSFICVQGHGFSAIYKPLIDNEFHSEIHESPVQIQLRGKRPKRLLSCSIRVK